MPGIVHTARGQRFRRWFRGCRLILLFLIFLLLGGLTYLNCVGLPEFLKARLVSELRARGVILKFSRMRLRWYHGLVAENVSLGPVSDPDGPRLSVGEVDLKFDRGALHRLHFQVTSLVLHDGQLALPLATANEPRDQFIVQNITTELHLLPDDQWKLDHFRALCLGARVELSGTLTNASAIYQWQLPPASPPPAGGGWQMELRRVVKRVRQMRFSRSPEVFLNFVGDARELARTTVDLRIDARDAETPWGNLAKLLLVANLNHQAGGNEPGESEIKIQLDETRTQWGQAKLSRCYLHWTRSPLDPKPAEVRLDLELSGVDSPWGSLPAAHVTGRAIPSGGGTNLVKTEWTFESSDIQAERLHLDANRLAVQMTHSPGNLMPLEFNWQMKVEGAQSPWGDAQKFQINGHAARPPEPVLPVADVSGAGGSAFEPFQIDWDSQLDHVALTNVVADRIVLAGEWRAPELAIHKFHADLGGHPFDASAQIHLGTREARIQSDLAFDLHRIEGLLTPYANHWLSQYAWTEPPRISARARLILPAWNGPKPDWRSEVLPTLDLDGEFRTGEAAFRGVLVSEAHSHFSFSNSVWQLPDFVATRPDGGLEFGCTSDMRNHDYHFKFRASMDPLALEPLFGEQQSNVFDYFHFSGPPGLEGEVWGEWRDPQKLGMVARVTATNLVIRDVPIGEMSANVAFTNGFLTATDVRVSNGEPQVSVDGAGYDLASQTIYLTNAFSTMDPKLITHAIGPHTEQLMSHYLFQSPPTARVDGWVEVRHGKRSDLRFELSGGPFKYWKFVVPKISSVVRWVDQTVTITNLLADFYRGKLAANMFFDCAAPLAADFNLDAHIIDVDLHQLMADLTSPTNRLEGTLSGEMTITRANTGDWSGWNGFGHAKLRDGFLWDMPLFGIFSSVLNTVIPGMGSSRVSGGTATFTITNSVIHTDDMDIRSAAMRLAYRGFIDFQGRVNARVEARLLRDAWLVGPIVSAVLSPLTKMFEYKVTGTLHEPEKEPLYIPKPFMFPFHPFRTLKELFIEEKPD